MTTRAGKGEFQDWAELRTHAIELFNGETPHPATEQQIIDAYQQHPQAVERELPKVAADLTAGTIRSGWAIYAKRAERILTPPSNPTRPASLDREKAITRAEQWIRAAGIHFDRDTEIMLELFGDLGQLRTYTQVDYQQTGLNEQGHPVWALTEPQGDIALLERMTKLYHDVRPAGITIETDALARAEKWKSQHAARQALAQTKAEAATDDHQPAPLTDIDYAADNHPPGDLHDPPTEPPI